VKLNDQQINQLTQICYWILGYDKDLPNRDGDETNDVVNNAVNLLALLTPMNQAKCLELATNALSEVKAQIKAARGDVIAFNDRSQGPWFYQINEEPQMGADLVEIEKALDFIQEMQQE
tara:strand:+ start:91 stop:447 length:357 start_codon:yes stop_codon:yes gene_type:complete